MSLNRLAVMNDSSSHEHGSGSFAAGFLIGVVAGAAGLWLTQNEKGQELITRLKEELKSTLEEELQHFRQEPNTTSAKKTSETAPSSATTTSGKKFPKFAAKRSRRS